ncbi:Cytochrome P450 monooxygenase mpaDE [Psilocybe cubensis]|uniref:Cytochrome P450 monooxygenase mpaDE n=2 Tax=Psilocybe cubensis TaxID=181762 RepID=A0ACB8GYB3_PSICU|nr:Cytochrome P450 monooxygenase mpaDE [Psilocybe cubensis]KAH9480449.1 Cytochrome P450 monooxygenase mpaDE [Psilocybe cubensis]
MSLPQPAENQAYCNVSALEAGLIDLLDTMFITNAVSGMVTKAPSLSFLIRHSTRNENFVFDLGIRKDWENYPPAIVEWAKKTYPVDVKQDVVESLQKGGLQPTDIKYVCLSHLHWDHTGNTHPFTNSTFLIGTAAQSLLQESKYPDKPDGRYSHDLLPSDRTLFLDPGEWKPIGPFPRSFDFYGDGSLYIIDAAGHLPGHINVLARTSSDGGWIFLGGDSAHHWNLITLESDVAVGHPGHLHICAHADKELAEEHIRRINALWKLPRVRVIIAHDEPWYSKNKGGDAFWPGKIASL